MLAEFYRQQRPSTRLRLVLIALLAGLTDAAFLIAIGETFRSTDRSSLSTAGRFFLTGVLQFICLRDLFRALSNLIEADLYATRCRIASRLCRAELHSLEKIGATEIYTQVTQTTDIISNSIVSIVTSIRSFLAIFFMALYISYFSMIYLVALLTIFGGSGFIYYRLRKEDLAIVRNIAIEQTRLFRIVTDMLKGVKEVRLHVPRGDDLLSEISEMATALGAGPIRLVNRMQRNLVFNSLTLFLMLAGIVFVLPLLVPAVEESVYFFISLAIVIFERSLSLLRALPEYERAEAAAQSLKELEETLEQAMKPEPEGQEDPWGGRFTSLEVVNLRFLHLDADGQTTFTLGPMSFALRAGEVVFFVGGNGSGKTTLLKLLTTLYTPESGVVLVDGIAVNRQNLQAYRNLCTGIFSDFHLFEKLYGMLATPPEEVSKLLQKLKIAEVTAYRQGRFSRLSLSTGQRKRLAMAVALLEDRALYVFDEWAADQDPEFRRYYYQELLPELRRRGKTVLAISHDDRYYDCADRVISLEYGAVRSIDGQSSSAATPRLPSLR